MDAVILGHFIAQMRKENKMTQVELAEKLHVTDKAVSKWERGKGIPDIVNIEGLANIFNITILELLECERGIDNMDFQSKTNEEINRYKLIVEKYKKNQIIREIVIASIVAIIGAFFLISGARHLIYPYIPFSTSIQGGIDGPSAIYSVSKVPVTKSICSCLLGGILVSSSIIMIYLNYGRRKKNE